MDAEAIVAAIGIYAGAFVVGAVSSLVPIISIDLFLVGLTLAAGPGIAVPVIALAAAGQVAGKLPIYAATRGATALAAARGPTALAASHRARLERMRARIARWQRARHLVLATSALVGLPPFSIVATAAGVMAIRPRPFCAIVFIGRAARFAIVIACVGTV